MRDPLEVFHHSDGQPRPDFVIAELAAKQHGVMSRAQLLARGVQRGAIELRLRHRRLHQVHRGVYSVTPGLLSAHARWMAAVLAGGAGAALSHWSAASLLGLRTGHGPLSHVTIPSRRPRRPGLTFHSGDLPDDEVTEHDGIPVTVPARTILDLAPSLSIPSLSRMVERAEGMAEWHGPSIPEIVQRYPRRAGIPKLRALIAQPLGMTRSELEARFLLLIDEWGLPRPQTNISVEGFEVDCVWPERGVIVELDVYATHGSRHAFERDRQRDRALRAAGWTVIRVTDLQLEHERAGVRRDLHVLLG